jgi:spore coat protein U-like protein
LTSRKLAATMAVAAALCVGSASGARAAAKCSFTVVTGVSFGNYNVFNPLNTLANGTLDVDCKGVGRRGTSITISLAKGNSPTFSRYLLKAAIHLNYNLYLDPALTTIWGDGTGGTSFFGPMPVVNNVPVVTTIYGQIPAAQDVSGGAYTDTITATVSY